MPPFQTMLLRELHRFVKVVVECGKSPTMSRVVYHFCLELIYS